LEPERLDALLPPAKSLARRVKYRSIGRRWISQSRYPKEAKETVMSPVNQAFGRESAGSKAPHRIDGHHHIMPAEYGEAAKAGGSPDAGGVAYPEWSPEAAISLMDRHGIAFAMTSIAAPGVHFGDVVAARSLARRCNEISARLVADHPSRFGALAVLPLP